MTSPSFGSTASGGKRWAVSLDQSLATTTRGSHARLIALAGRRYQLTVAKAPAMKAKDVTIDIRVTIAFSLSRPSTQNHEFLSIRHVCFGSLADMSVPTADVRMVESG